MFRLLRFYSIASFICIFLTAAVLTLFYRQVTIQWIIQITERGDLTLARTARNAIYPSLVEFLTERERHAGRPSQVYLDDLGSHFKNLMRNTSVVRIKLYDRHGTVVFSTQPSQIGHQQADNPGFQKAINGQAASSLLYRDTFNRFDGSTAEDNLMQTYIPLREGGEALPLGVFEIYTDINPLVRENERNLIIILIGAEIILALLYAALVLLVRRARNIIAAQQQTIQERTAMLETLSAQLMDSEEQQKKKIAIDLHEGLAQTLSAVKMNVENSSSKFDASKTGAFSLEPVVQVLKTAIQEVRSIATELRPSSLDDLGLLPTINWFCREFEKQHPGNRIELDISLQEQEVPAALKIVIYRAIESAFKNIGQQPGTSQTRLMLRLFGHTVTLMISTTAPVPGGEKTPDLYQRFSEMQERTALSGGVFSATRNGAGSFILCATWPGFS